MNYRAYKTTTRCRTLLQQFSRLGEGGGGRQKQLKRIFFLSAASARLFSPYALMATKDTRAKQAVEHRKQEKGKITGNLHKIQLSECCLRIPFPIPFAIPFVCVSLFSCTLFSFLYARVMNYHISCGFHTHSKCLHSNL